jgi:4'-phosphopantetheinyl transferase
VRDVKPAASWHAVSEHPHVSTRTVHVWRAHVDRLASKVDRFRELLAGEELDRAASYHFARDRARFITTRAVLRLLLGRYLKGDPARVRVLPGPGGKPEVVGGAERSIRFNVSRSDGLALLAFTLERHVGVDIERVRPDVATDTVAETFFAPREVVALRALPAWLQPEAFFDTWTRKEAFVKAAGQGLAHGFDVVGVDGSRQDLARWSVRPLHPAPGYAGALVVEGTDWELQRYDADEAVWA